MAPQNQNRAIEIIPALLCDSRPEFEEKIRVLETFAGMVQIDVLDGSWLDGQKSWADKDYISEILSPLLFEVHLMVTQPLIQIPRWCQLPSVRRIIFHIETMSDPTETKRTIEAIRFHGREACVALNPETSFRVIDTTVRYVDEVLFLTVQPGASGRTFEQPVLKKISEFSKIYPKIKVGVDGGISDTTILPCITAGVSRLVVNSALFGARVSPRDAWQHLQEVAARA